MAAFPALFSKKETGSSYRHWRSITLALFENFKFNYEYLGTGVEPQSRTDIHASHYLKQLPGYKAEPLYFGEKHHVHANSFLAYGNRLTGYPMGNKNIASHHFTLETYQYIWYAPLNFISNWQETFPLVFSLDHNYFMESCNGTFLQDDRYLQDQAYPCPAPEHKKYFTSKFFTGASLPGTLLLNGFSIDGIGLPDTTIRTLNFCLRIFQVASLMQAALMEIFGPSTNKSDQVKHLRDHWSYPDGKNVKDVSLYRLNILAFLYLSMHPAVTALCYGLYRNKYGVKQTHRTAFFVPTRSGPVALKDFLAGEISAYIEQLNQALKSKTRPNSKVIPTKISAALDLARMFGIGYQTNQQKGVNVHKNAPYDFRPKNLAPELRSLDFIAEHSENSPLWRIFYDYSGEWWSNKQIEQLLEGQGPEWEELRSVPRSLAVHLFHQIAAHFWKDTLDRLNYPERLNKLIRARYQKILADPA
ncbi:MAG: hypothetical protein JW782_06590 [Candidatus Saganbacteria bacterium]|nr:hypothetical protein [Candidatus Saganbacteria bacterium]